MIVSFTQSDISMFETDDYDLLEILGI